MATLLSKVLQKPTIISIIGSTIRVAHPDISKNPSTTLASPISAGATTAVMTVLDNNGFIDDDWFLSGWVGTQEAEEMDIAGAVTRGTTIPVANPNTLKFDHEINGPVVKIYERAIAIYGAATDGGAGELITSIGAIAAPIADAFNIQWNRQYTEYTIQSDDTAYVYYYVVFADGTNEGPASDYVLATGLASNSVMYMINQALDTTNTELDDQNITLEQCVRWADNAQVEISQFMFQDPTNGRYTQRDWDFEVSEDITTLSISENENRYDIADLSMKYGHDKSIINITLGAKPPLSKITIQDMEDLLAYSPRTDVATATAVGDITLTVDSNVEFEDEGVLYVGDDTITYTGKTGTTIFTGIPATGDGSITAIHAVDAPVWQNVAPGVPTKYAIFNGKIIFNYPPEESLEGYPIKIKFFKKLTSLTDASDTTEVTFSNIIQNYIASKIELRKGNADSSNAFKKDFSKGLLDNAISNSIPTLDYYTYYNFI